MPQIKTSRAARVCSKLLTLAENYFEDCPTHGWRCTPEETPELKCRSSSRSARFVRGSFSTSPWSYERGGFFHPAFSIDPKEQMIVISRHNCTRRGSRPRSGPAESAVVDAEAELLLDPHDPLCKSKRA